MTREGWRLIRLGDLLEDIEAGWSPQCDGHPADEDAWGVLKVSAVSSGTYISDENKALPKNEIPRPEIEIHNGDLLLVRANGVLDLVGRSVLVRNTRRRLMLSDKILRLKQKTNIADAGFLNAFLGFGPTREVLTNITGGSHMRNISQRAIRELIVTCPPLLEQQKIASILLAIDDVINATRTVIDQLGVVKKALMAELLTRGIPGRHTKFKQTEIGEVPEGWLICSISDLGYPGEPVVRTGPFGSSMKSIDFQPEGIKVLTIQSLGEGEILQEGLFHVTEEKAAELADYQVKVNDVVFSRVADIGRCAAISKNEAGWLISSNLSRIRLDPQKADALFLMNLITMGAAVTRQVEAVAGNAGRPVISSSVLKELRLPLPNIEEQLEIAAAGRKLRNRAVAENRALVALRSMKTALMSALLSGDLRVTPDEHPA